MNTKKVVSIFFIMLLLPIADKLFAQDYSPVNNPLLPANEKESEASVIVAVNLSYQWEFSDLVSADFNTPEFFHVEEHELGKEVACLKYITDKTYIYKENPVPGDPVSRILIKKQNIYDALRNVEKYYRKQAKKNLIPTGEAAKQYAHILKIGISAVYEENTRSFEEALSKEKKDPEKQILLFKQVKLISIY